MSKPTVALIEDDPAFNELLGLYIDADDDFELIATGYNGQEALDIASCCAPDVFLMDLHMPVMDGIEASRQILATNPDARIIAITTFDSYDYVNRALAVGVHGYLLKNSGAKEIKQAIVAAIEGRAIIDRKALASLVVSLNVTHPPQGSPWDELAKVEQDVVRRVCLGYTNQEIAAELHYSLSNVKNILSQVYKKFGISTRTQLLVYAGKHSFPVGD
ncbi:MAG: response regulator transcription factor [Rothia sp. (in: high G+C Gram-positive bacteria)]|nr:response regulator transcription factor [Rothia sp. (in: high G+C Gram-positive bacteria)]